MGVLDKLFGDDEPRKPNSTDADRKDSRPRTTDRPVADFSDVHGSSSSTSGPADRQYTVKSGDSLSKIAQAEYGDPGQWRRIYNANRGSISNPDLIHPGQVLSIPDLSAEES